MVSGQPTAGGTTGTGSLSISGQTATFDADDGAIDMHTFLPTAGEPVLAFSLDDDVFTRVD